jgi:hypothetical protein
LGLGLAVSSVGVKDVILPGEMKTMEENRTLLRLKELETLEKVTEKIDKLTVYGGLEGVLKDVVRIAEPKA